MKDNKTKKLLENADNKFANEREMAEFMIVLSEQLKYKSESLQNRIKKIKTNYEN